MSLPCSRPDLLWAWDGALSGDRDATIAAVEACKTCVARLDCYHHGLELKEQGVWGGVLLTGRPGRVRDRCERGHALAGPNLYRSPSGRKICRTCRRQREAA